MGQDLEEVGQHFEITEFKLNFVQYKVEDGIALFTLNDPPANTYSYEMMRTLDSRILAARMDQSVQVIVITGANETLSRLEQTPKLVIAAINGHCVGGGLEVAMAADIRIARRGAGKMGLPEVSLGVLPGTGGTQRLPRLVGKSQAIELMATGELFDLERGLELGILNHIYDAEDAESFMQQVLAYAGKFTTPNRAANAVGRIKRSVQSGAEIPFESALALERELQQQLFQSEDAREGLAAYVEKRKPVFKGK